MLTPRFASGGPLLARLDRRMDFDLAVSEWTLYLSLGDETLTGVVTERRIEG